MTGLPKGWITKTLGEVAVWGSGGTPQAGNPRYYGGEIPWAIIGDLNDGEVQQTEKTITQEGLANSSAKMVPVGALLIAMYGSIGKMGIAKVPMATNQAIAFALPKPDQVIPQYLFWYLRSQREIFLSNGKGATQQNISQTLLKAWEIPVPPLDEQRRIVETLDYHLSRLDNALAEIQAADLGLTNLKHASLDSLFMGDSEPFPTVTLGTLGKWVTGSTPKTSNPLYQGEDVPFVTPGDIFYGGEILSVRRRISNIGADVVRRLPAPSVQVVCIGATLGKVGYSLEEVTTNQQITSLLPDDKVVTAGYAAWLLSSPLVQSLLWKSSSSTTVPILNKGTLEQIEVPLAPLEKQSEILAQIDTQTELSSSLSERTTLARGNVSSLRRSILNRAFSGKLLEVKV